MSQEYVEQVSFEHLLNEPRPYVPPGTHPVEDGTYIIPTNEVLRMYQSVVRWIKYRSTGGIIYGRPRLGKTRAIEYLMRILPKEFGQSLPIFHIRSLHAKMANEGTFFESLLKDVGHGVPFSGKPSIKRDRLTKFLIEKGDFSTHKRVVLFIDEAQCLLELQYGWLMDVYNELDQMRIAMTVILVGQEELIHNRSLFIRTKKQQIIGRFMVHEQRFTGVTSKEDLEACLSGFDQIAEYPPNSGWSYTRYFFPVAYAMGNRLQYCADDLYNVFFTLRQKAKIKGPFEIPMQYIITTIEYIFLEYGTSGQGVEWITKTMWEEAVYSSGYIHAELRIPSRESENE